MVSLARANLLHEKAKIILSMGGVILGVFLIFTTVGLYQGISSVVEKMTTEAGADLWITSKGASGSIHSPSILTEDVGEYLPRIDGVAGVSPLIRMPLAVTIGGKKYLVYINGYDTASGLGGPWNIRTGAAKPENGEIIIDRVLAQKGGLEVGQDVDLEGQEFRVVGISDETYLMVASMVFITYDDARAFLPPGLTNFFLVRTTPGVPVKVVQARIQQQLPNVSVTTSESNAADSTEETVGGFLPIIFVISAIGVLVGILVVGLLVYTMTIEKSREYGILRAVGADNAFLYRVVLFQSMTVSLAGFIIGAAVSPPLISFLRSLVPEFFVVISPTMILWVFLLYLATGVIASLIPVKRLASIDPAVVFKE